MIIPFVNLKKQSRLEKKTILKAVKQTLKSSNFILGDSNINLEKKISHFKKSKYCALLNSGTDALTLGLHVLGIKRGDEVITCSNSVIATKDKILFKNPTSFAKPIALIKEGRLLILKKCEQEWCQITSGKFQGWVKTDNIWGFN